MLRLKDFSIVGCVLLMTVLIEGDESKSYRMSVNMDTEYLTVVESNIPDEYKIYERQAKTALRQYRGKELPNVVTSMWC